MKIRCYILGHIPDKPEVIKNLIPYQDVYCKRCGKLYHYTTAR